jgi:hypothetical protein
MRLLPPIIARRQKECTVAINNHEESKNLATGNEMRSLLALQSTEKVIATVDDGTDEQNVVTLTMTREKTSTCPYCVMWFLLMENILILILMMVALFTKNEGNNNDNDSNTNTNTNHAWHDWLGEQAFKQENSSASERCYIPTEANGSSPSQVPRLHSTTTPIGSSLVEQNIDYFNLIRDPQYSMTNICILQGSGLGSQLLNMIAQKIYFTDRERIFIVDDTQYGYKWQDNITGVLNGFFTPKFPVLQMGEWDNIIRSQFSEMPSMDTLLQMGSRRVYTDTDQKVEIMWAIAQPYRDEFPKAYGRRSIPLYTRFATEACLHLQFNEHAKLEMKKLLDLHQIPSDLRRKSHSVAFHVRRGDKIGTESKLYPGSTYVDKLVQVLATTSNNKPLDHCFIASDDYAAVEEVTESLKEQNLNCTIHTLTTTLENGSSYNVSTISGGFTSTLEFVTEMSLMVDATFFIGTFNSNVGALVSLLRKCYYVGTPHYAHSYGVDREDWFFRD